MQGEITCFRVGFYPLAVICKSFKCILNVALPFFGSPPGRLLSEKFIFHERSVNVKWSRKCIYLFSIFTIRCYNRDSMNSNNNIIWVVAGTFHFHECHMQTGLLRFHRVSLFLSFSTPTHQHPNTKVSSVKNGALGLFLYSYLRYINVGTLWSSCTGHLQHLLANV